MTVPGGVLASKSCVGTWVAPRGDGLPDGGEESVPTSLENAVTRLNRSSGHMGGTGNVQPNERPGLTRMWELNSIEIVSCHDPFIIEEHDVGMDIGRRVPVSDKFVEKWPRLPLPSCSAAHQAGCRMPSLLLNPSPVE